MAWACRARSTVDGLRDAAARAGVMLQQVEKLAAQLGIGGSLALDESRLVLARQLDGFLEKLFQPFPTACVVVHSAHRSKRNSLPFSIIPVRSFQVRSSAHRSQAAGESARSANQK